LTVMPVAIVPVTAMPVTAMPVTVASDTYGVGGGGQSWQAPGGMTAAALSPIPRAGPVMMSQPGFHLSLSPYFAPVF
jgi:hypothetical protein